MAEAASRRMLKVPIRLIWMARAKLSSLCGPSRTTIRSPGATPAQFTATSIRPKLSSAAWIAASPSAALVTSQR